MNCQNHPEMPATAYCRACGKPVCEQCRRDAFGTVYCAEHAPRQPRAPPTRGVQRTAAAAAVRRAPAVRGAGSRGCSSGHGLRVCRCLARPGLFPGHDSRRGRHLQRAVCQGHGARGDLGHPDEHRELARRARAGAGVRHAWWPGGSTWPSRPITRRASAVPAKPVDEYSSMLNLTGGSDQIPVAGIALILLGVLLLLHTLDLLDFEYVARFWPVLLIAAGRCTCWPAASPARARRTERCGMNGNDWRNDSCDRRRHTRPR